MPRGGRRPGAGRPKGVPNKATTAVREAFQKLLDGELDNLREALHEVRFGIEIEKQMENGLTVVGRLNANPKGYLELIRDYAEFCTPKLARSELAGDGGGPVVVEVVNYADKGGASGGDVE